MLIWRRQCVLVHSRLGFKADDGLMQHDLIEHAAQYIAVTLCGNGYLNSLGDSAAQRACGAGMLGEDLLADLGGSAGNILSHTNIIVRNRIYLKW